MALRTPALEALPRAAILAGDPAVNTPLPAPRSSDIPWEIWFAAPEMAHGFVFLGEPGKFVAVSPDRFKLIDSSMVRARRATGAR